jgi:hypothetical protein
MITVEIVDGVRFIYDNEKYLRELEEAKLERLLYDF